MPRAERSMPYAIHARYPAPAYFTTRTSSGVVVSTEAAPSAASVIRTASPVKTPAAAA
jgi:hypothetical protein